MYADSTLFALLIHFTRADAATIAALFDICSFSFLFSIIFFWIKFILICWAEYLKQMMILCVWIPACWFIYRQDERVRGKMWRKVSHHMHCWCRLNGVCVCVCVRNKRRPLIQERPILSKGYYNNGHISNKKKPRRIKRSKTTTVRCSWPLHEH